MTLIFRCHLWFVGYYSNLALKHQHERSRDDFAAILLFKINFSEQTLDSLADIFIVTNTTIIYIDSMVYTDSNSMEGESPSCA